MTEANLRRVGLGLDRQYSSKYPSGIESLCNLFRDRLSHLSIVSLKNVEDAIEFKRTCGQGLPMIHHLSGVAPGDPDGPHLDRLASLDSISRELGAQWCLEDIGIWSIGPYAIPYFAPPIFSVDVAEEIAVGILSVQQASSVPFAAEVPACPFYVGNLRLEEFFNIIVKRCDCPLVLDLSHVYSYAVAQGISGHLALSSLPLDSVWEIHVSGGVISEESASRYIDTHSHPIMEEVIELTIEAAMKCKNLRAVTYEVGVGLSADLIQQDFNRTETALRQIGWSSPLETTIPAALS